VKFWPILRAVGVSGEPRKVALTRSDWGAAARESNPQPADIRSAGLPLNLIQVRESLPSRLAAIEGWLLTGTLETSLQGGPRSLLLSVRRRREFPLE
jgi:hypothetical protein